MWDKETARRYDAWFQTEVGAFALKREMRLLERMTAAWPRRGQRLVEIGCGTGVFLEVLHHSGFDVTGLDASPDMLEQARGRLGARADLHWATPAICPLTTRKFDFAVLLTVLEFCPDPALVLQEAARVARKAVLVGFLNRCSFYGLSSKLWPGSTGKLLRNACWFTPWGLTGLGAPKPWAASPAAGIGADRTQVHLARNVAVAAAQFADAAGAGGGYLRLRRQFDPRAGGDAVAGLWGQGGRVRRLAPGLLTRRAA